ncbi:MAG: hypothetical protein ACJZ44_02845 [Nitrospinales bacterium]
MILPEKFIPDVQFGVGSTLQFLIKGKEKRLKVNAVLENKGIGKALNGNFALMDIAAAQKVFEKFGRLDRIDIQFVKKVKFEVMQKRFLLYYPNIFKWNDHNVKTNK